ncbi:hypothetical protein GCM10018793_69720 [Streptomyces sulfonofaciens]|uniref:Uncharacterized protein n=1 Tax=Streptomyces sulfonofaciens TaxID=68272 RepID=A0A919L9D0_9ACTN|nr:hypothetical protein GCM10018793_69720 [Streptomyces sulfonofaciens]
MSGVGATAAYRVPSAGLPSAPGRRHDAARIRLCELPAEVPERAGGVPRAARRGGGALAPGGPGGRMREHGAPYAGFLAPGADGSGGAGPIVGGGHGGGGEGACSGRGPTRPMDAGIPGAESPTRLLESHASPCRPSWLLRLHLASACRDPGACRLCPGHESGGRAFPGSVTVPQLALCPVPFVTAWARGARGVRTRARKAVEASLAGSGPDIKADRPCRR